MSSIGARLCLCGENEGCGLKLLDFLGWGIEHMGGNLAHFHFKNTPEFSVCSYVLHEKVQLLILCEFRVSCLEAEKEKRESVHPLQEGPE